MRKIKQKKPDRRYMSAIYLTPAEHDLLKRAAQTDGRPFSEFIRHHALAAARRRIPTPPQEMSHDAG